MTSRYNESTMRRKSPGWATARWPGWVLASVLLAGCNTGYRGGVYERLADGSIGPTIAGVEIKFVKEDGSVVAGTTSTAAGRYEAQLELGRYRVTAGHVSYEDYSSAPGFFVVTGSGYQTGNLFLRQPRVTTVLVVRHADRDGSKDALMVPQGTDRAARLAEVAARAGVTAIYSTNTVRTRSTVQPLAAALDLEIQLYTSEQDAAIRVATDHPGDVVLVVGHSNTTTGLAEAIVGQDLYPGAPNPHTDDFDNLFLVGRVVGASQGNVLNLQYGADSAPDTSGLSRAQITNVVLVRHAEPDGSGLSPAGQQRADDLARVVRKAGVSAVYAPLSTPAAATMAPVATALGVAVTSYGAGDIPALVAQVFQDHALETVVICGDNSALQALIGELGASPVPPLYGDEHDQLIVVQVPSQGTGRLVTLQYGAASP